jgi:hypothetical protein
MHNGVRIAKLYPYEKELLAILWCYTQFVLPLTLHMLLFPMFLHIFNRVDCFIIFF